MFGIQIAAGKLDFVVKCCELLSDYVDADFIDLNCGCPIHQVCYRGMGSGLMQKPNKIEELAQGMIAACEGGSKCVPLVTVKMRMGFNADELIAHRIAQRMEAIGVAAITVHGRTRAQRYTKVANWEYINLCCNSVKIPVIGNGDVYSYHDYSEHLKATNVRSMMIGRGALIKPWLFQEIKEQRDWDISAAERLDILKDFVKFGFDHWGADEKGVSFTRRFILELLSFTHRYVPVGLLEVLPQKLNQRIPSYFGRSDLETLMASPKVEDWIKIQSLVLGPAPPGFTFIPKHKSNSVDAEG